jgi:hypothetical protein
MDAQQVEKLQRLVEKIMLGRSRKLKNLERLNPLELSRSADEIFLDVVEPEGVSPEVVLTAEMYLAHLFDDYAHLPDYFEACIQMKHM